jgi:ribosome-associated translation inhibitor RaiA
MLHCGRRGPAPAPRGAALRSVGLQANPLQVSGPILIATNYDPTSDGGDYRIANRKGSLMNTLPEITFHGIEKSEAIERRVLEKVAKLERHFGRMTRCRVVIEAPNRSPEKLKIFQIKIEISLPRRQPIVITHERTGSHAHDELPLLIREAFDAALRKVDDMAYKTGARTKLERGRRRPRTGASAEA